MRSIDWSSDVFSSDLASVRRHHRPAPRHYAFLLKVQTDGQIYLPRGPVIGGENAFGTQGRAKARRSVGEDEFARIDRKSVVAGKSVSVRVVIGGRRINKKRKRNNTNGHHSVYN